MVSSCIPNDVATQIAKINGQPGRVTKRLPLWKWLQLAVDDVRKISRRRGFKINMGVWRTRRSFDPSNPNEDQPCMVCCFGALLTGTMGVPVPGVAHEFSFAEFPNGVRDLARSINALRSGYVYSAVADFFPGDRSLLPVGWEDRPAVRRWRFAVQHGLQNPLSVRDYASSARGWHQDMKALIDWMRKRGI